jgi:multiple sugar transport system substrate-binding protein
MSVVGAKIRLAGVLCAGSLGIGGLGLSTAVAAHASARTSASTVVITEEDANTYPDSAVVDQLISEFEKANPGYKVERTVVPVNKIESVALHQASSHSLPDVLGADDQWMPEFAAAGALTPLSQFGYSGAGLDKAAMEVGSYNGKLYGVATGTNSLSLIYNKKMLAAAHLTPPTTWAQLETDAKKLTHGNVYGIAFALGQVFTADWQFEPFFWSDGGILTKVNGTAGVQALSFMTQLFKDGSAAPADVSWNQTQSTEAFIHGQAAMLINGAWEAPALSATPGLQWSAEAIPSPRPGLASIGPIGGGMWVIPTTSAAQENAAWKFLQFLMKPSSVTLFCNTLDEVPGLTSLDASLIKTNPTMALFAGPAETGKSRVGDGIGIHYPAVAQALTAAIQAAVLGRQTPAQALDTAQSQITAALKS